MGLNKSLTFLERANTLARPVRQVFEPFVPLSQPTKPEALGIDALARVHGRALELYELRQAGDDQEASIGFASERSRFIGRR